MLPIQCLKQAQRTGRISSKRTGATTAGARPWLRPFVFGARAAWPALLALLVCSPLHLLLREHIPVEVPSGLTIAGIWLLTRRFKWDEKCVWAMFCGYLFSLSGPDINLGFLAFVALLPLLFAILRAEGLIESVIYGAVTGATIVYVSFSWGTASFANYCGLNTVAAYTLFLPFTLLLSLKFPLFAAAVHVTRSYRIPLFLLVPVFLGAAEFLKLELYPWYLGLSQISNPRLAQLADLVGIVGLSAFVGFINALLLDAFLKRRWSQAGWAVACILAAALYGHIRIALLAPEQGTHITVGVVQPNTPSRIPSGDTALKTRIGETLYDLSRRLLASGKPDLIVFAEGSALMGYQGGYNPEFAQAYRRIAREADTPILTDNVHGERDGTGRLRVWRGAILIAPDGSVRGQYLKRRLAPFGEYIPMGSTFPILSKLFRYSMHYERGEDPTLLEVGDARIAPEICFEIIHPSSTREHVGKAANLIVNLSNDSWFDEPKQAQQHLALACFRCIELKMPMVRVTNTGISAFVDRMGRIQPPASPLNTTWTAVREVELGHEPAFSIYRLLGDWFGWFCVAASLGILTHAGVIHHRARKDRGSTVVVQGSRP